MPQHLRYRESLYLRYTMRLSWCCCRQLGSAFGTPTASPHNLILPMTYLDAASSSYLHRSSSSSVWVAFSAGKRKRRVSHGVGAWPPMASSPCPGPPTCMEHFDLLLCLPEPSGQSDLCFLQPPVRHGHQGGADAAAPKVQKPLAASPPLPHHSVTPRKYPPEDARMCPSHVTP